MDAFAAPSICRGLRPDRDKRRRPHPILGLGERSRSMAVAGTTSWIVAMPPSRTLPAYHILLVHSLSLAHLTSTRPRSRLIDAVLLRPSGSRCIRVAWEEGGAARCRAKRQPTAYPPPGKSHPQSAHLSTPRRRRASPMSCAQLAQITPQSTGLAIRTQLSKLYRSRL